MVRIAIVEERDADAEKLRTFLERFARESGEIFTFSRYREANAFLGERGQVFDLVFIDVLLPGINGMEAAVRLRKTNARTLIVFVTKSEAFAAKSYEVDALDYIIKPVTYKRLCLRMGRALRTLEAKQGRLLTVRDKTGPVQLSTDAIYYIEIHKHQLTYHTETGMYTENGSLKGLAEALAPYGFLPCNACYLVNLKFAFRMKGFFVTMTNGDVLKISQPKRKAFMAAFLRGGA